MNGVNLSEAAHSVLAVFPQSVATATAQCFHMKQAEHVSIYVLFGAESGSPLTVPTSIVVNQCTNASGGSATPLASFRYAYQLLSGAGNDVLNGNAQALSNTVGPGPNWTTSTSGITSFPASTNGLVYIIEIDSAELEAIADAVGPQTEYPYIQVVVTNANAEYITILAVLTGLRYAEKGGYTMTT